MDGFLKSVDFDGKASVMSDHVVFAFKHEISIIKERAVVSVFTEPVKAPGVPSPLPGLLPHVGAVCDREGVLGDDWDAEDARCSPCGA